MAQKAVTTWMHFCPFHTKWAKGCNYLAYFSHMSSYTFLASSVAVTTACSSHTFFPPTIFINSLSPFCQNITVKQKLIFCPSLTTGHSKMYMKPISAKRN